MHGNSSLYASLVQTNPNVKTYLLTNYSVESQLALLRKMRSVARKQPVDKRKNLFHAVYGKIHGHLEYCEQAVHQSNTKAPVTRNRGDG